MSTKFHPEISKYPEEEKSGFHKIHVQRLLIAQISTKCDILAVTTPLSRYTVSKTERYSEKGGNIGW